MAHYSPRVCPIKLSLRVWARWWAIKLSQRVTLVTKVRWLIGIGYYWGAPSSVLGHLRCSKAQRWFYNLHGPRVIFSKKSHFPKIFKNASWYVFSNCVKLCMLVTIPSQGWQLSLLQTFWYQNELPRSFCSQDGILPKYEHMWVWPFRPFFEI